MRHDDLSPDEREQALLELSSRERARFAGLTPPRAAAYLAGRALLRKTAGELLGVAPADVPLSARCPDCGDEHGRPLLDGTTLHVGLAHAGTSVAVAASWGRAVGVDLESLTVSPERLDAIGALTGIRSLRHWTRIEAVLKADGRGLRVDPGAVRVDADAIATIRGEQPRYRLLDLPDEAGLIVTIALAD